MPIRILKDSIFESEKISELTDFQFRLWVSLILSVDDYGRGDARPAMIKGRAFPLRGAVRENAIQEGLLELERSGCIFLYEVSGRPFLCFPKWDTHQRIRQKTSRYPAPPEDYEPPTLDSKSPQIAADCCEMPLEKELEKEREKELEKEGKKEARTRFTPPTLEDVKAYCFERNSPVDPKQFFEYFSEGGWKDSKGNPVRNWKQKLITWEKYQPDNKKDKSGTSNPFLKLLMEEMS